MGDTISMAMNAAVVINPICCPLRPWRVK
jgi:hypothetical protein